jgi:hypothetical protein
LGTLLVFSYAWLTGSLPVPSAGHVLVAARNLYEGRGFVGTGVIPAFLPYYKEVGPPTPYLWYPLLPVVTSWLFLLFGLKPWVVLVLPMTSYFLAGFALYVLGQRLFGSATALGGAAFLLIHPIFLSTSMADSLGDSIVVFLLIASVLCLFLARESSRFSTAWILLAGGALGVAQYARSAATMLYVPMTILMLMAFSGYRLIRLGVFVIGCLVVQLPLFAWHLNTIGSLTFTPTYLLLFLTSSFPGLSAITQLVPTGHLTVFQQYSGEILQKWLSQVWVHYKYLFSMMSPLVLVAALLTYSVSMNRSQALLRRFAFILYLGLVGLNSLVIWDNRYLLPAIPFFSLLGAEWIRRIWSGLPLQRFGKWAASGVVTLLVAAPTVDVFYQAVKARTAQLHHRHTMRELAQFVKDNAEPETVVMTVQTDPLIWETRSSMIELPSDLETATRIYREFIRFDTILLVDPLPLGHLYHYSPQWYELMDGRKKFLAFYRDKEITLGSGERVVLLRDGSRSRMR